MPIEYAGASEAVVAAAQGRTDLATDARSVEKTLPLGTPDWAIRFITEYRRRTASGESRAGMRPADFGAPANRTLVGGQLYTRTARPQNFCPDYAVRYMRELMIRTLGKIVHGEYVSPAGRRAVDRFVAFEMAKEPVRSAAERDANLNRWADAGRALMAHGNPTERHRRRLTLALS